MRSTLPFVIWFVNGEFVVSVEMSRNLQMYCLVTFRIRAPGRSPLSVRIWNPLQIPITSPPLSANSFTDCITGENFASAPVRR